MFRTKYECDVSYMQASFFACFGEAGNQPGHYTRVREARGPILRPADHVQLVLLFISSPIVLFVMSRRRSQKPGSQLKRGTTPLFHETAETSSNERVLVSWQIPNNHRHVNDR